MDFNNFTTDSFEQLVHALSVKVFGNGVAIFGNGPDGGREATFNGKVNFPIEGNESWDGYGVIQAKYKERIENRDAEFKWAYSQLEKELKLWEKSKNREPKPDYFIFCTNVELTSSAGGGKDKLNELINSYKSNLELAGYDIWDKDKLSVLIDCHSEIRRRFTAFFTSGDLLAEIAKQFAFEADITTLMTYVRNELLAERDAKITQAGDRTGDSLDLATVFVDLPSSVNKFDEPNDHHSFNSMRELLSAAACNLDPINLESNNISSYSGQYVFIGGPGSGKSTIGQFLSQIHRAAILERLPQSINTGTIKKAISTIKEKCVKEDFSWPKTPRYPFRIDLNQFAKKLAKKRDKDGISSLSQYIRSKISIDIEIKHTQLLNWFEALPCILIFDGLDEVPNSANREEVILCIQNFLGDIRAREADVLVIASSRPDGYRNEFDDSGVKHQYLLPLTKKQSLSCAEGYIRARYEKHPSKRIEETDKIKEALENHLVEKLMQSPLQITFMVTVLDSHGTPSESRWQLFDDYYRTIYAREKQKAVAPFDKVLNKRKPVIDVIHHDVAFHLQSEAETKQTNAELPINEFSCMVEELLEKDGLEGEELKNELNYIIGAANQRLVFLTSKKPELLSFEVRSLQEYMAAMKITTGSADKVIERMHKIALSDYWRNTLLFAVGRFFHDAQFYQERDRIRILCDDLNKSDFTDAVSAIKPGSILALDILESGTLGNRPAFIRGLIATALELLDTSPNELNFPSRISNLATSNVKAQFIEKIEMRLGQREISKTLSTWLLYAYLRKADCIWISEVKAKFWPDNEKDRLTILNLFYSRDLCKEDEHNELAKLSLRIHPAISSPLNFSFNFENVKNDIFSEILKILLQGHNRLNRNVSKPILKTGLSLVFNRVFHYDLDIDSDRIEAFVDDIRKKDPDDIHPCWYALLNLSKFITNPTKKSLEIATLSIVKQDDTFLYSVVRRGSPWIILYSVNYYLLLNKLPNFTFPENEFSVFCDSIEDGFQKKEFEIEELLCSNETNILESFSNSRVHIGGEIENINLIINELSELRNWKNNLAAILFLLSCRVDDLENIEIETLTKALERFDGNLFIHSVPLAPKSIFESKNLIHHWSRFYAELVKFISPGYFENKGVVFPSENVNINYLTKLNFEEMPEIIRLICYFISCGLHIKINKALLKTSRKFYSDSVYQLILELEYSNGMKKKALKVSEIMRQSSLDEKKLLLSFLASRRGNTYYWVEILYDLIKCIDCDDGRLKGMAQKLHIELVCSLPSEMH